MHSAEDWEELLLPEIERQRKQGKQVVFRADAAFAKPELYEALEERGWIKEGKQAVKMTRLSWGALWTRFRSNEVRLWLSVIAYNLGNTVAGAPSGPRAALARQPLVPDQSATAIGDDRRPGW